MPTCGHGEVERRVKGGVAKAAAVDGSRAARGTHRRRIGEGDGGESEARCSGEREQATEASVEWLHDDYVSFRNARRLRRRLVRIFVRKMTTPIAANPAAAATRARDDKELDDSGAGAATSTVHVSSVLFKSVGRVIETTAVQ